MAYDPADKDPSALLPLRQVGPGATPEEALLLRGLAGAFPARPGSAAEAGWAAIEQQALVLARRRRRWYLLRELVGGLAAPRALAGAAALGALVMLLDGRGGDPRGALRLEQPRAALQGGAQARAAELLDGAQLLLRGGSAEIDQVDERQTRVALRAGKLAVQVPKLPERGRLVVATADAEVIVHGTRFEVVKADAEATLVVVHEGLVEVRPLGGRRPATFLRPGERLSVPSLPRYRAWLEEQVRRLVSERRCEDARGLTDAFLDLATADMDVGAALYLKGLCAAQGGRRDEAVGYFERAAERTRDAVRADNALARAAQLRTEEDAAAGRQAWQRYLRRFPGGLHQDSARGALAQPGPR